MACVRSVNGAVCSRKVAETNAEVDLGEDLLSGILCAGDMCKTCGEVFLTAGSHRSELDVMGQKSHRIMRDGA